MKKPNFFPTLYGSFIFETNEVEALHMLHAIRDNISLKDAPPAPQGQNLLACDILTQAFRETFPQALENQESLYQTFIMSLTQI